MVALAETCVALIGLELESAAGNLISSRGLPAFPLFLDRGEATPNFYRALRS
jgi:hypothetical protein